MAWFALAAAAMENVVLRRDGKEIAVRGRVEVEARDGGILLLGQDGELWPIPPENQVKRSRDNLPFQALSRAEMAKQLLAELPPGFQAYKTAHYLILHDTSPAYAQWCGSLFEGLYRAFTSFWAHKGLKLSEPEFPLVAIVFANQQAYRQYSRPMLGEATEAIAGYYAVLTNRMTMYDLTGLEAQGPIRGNASVRINQILAQPRAAQTLSTIVHEATHQMAFNCGLQTRLSDCPLWVNEGIAVFFEAPDLRSPKGGNRIGGINYQRFKRFVQYCARRPENSLETLLRDDSRLRDTERGLDAYAEAWALTYFLLRQRTKEYVAYVKRQSEKKPFLNDDAQTRLNEFQQAFGDLKCLDADFLRYMATLR